MKRSTRCDSRQNKSPSVYLQSFPKTQKEDTSSTERKTNRGMANLQSGISRSEWKIGYKNTYFQTRQNYICHQVRLGIKNLLEREDQILQHLADIYNSAVACTCCA